MSKKAANEIPPLYIRSDASSAIGTGHIMRCIALAQAWRAVGGTITFLTHCESDALRRRIKDEGFDCIALRSPHPHPEDLSQTLEAIRPSAQSQGCPWVVMDGYHFDPDYQRQVVDAGSKLLIIDDMNHLRLYHADLLLNQNIFSESIDYQCAPETVMLLGTQYVLLRREFLAWEDWHRAIARKARKILVTLGGADPENVTQDVLEAVMGLDQPDFEIRVVTGPANPNMENLRRACHSGRVRCDLMPNVRDMPRLMKWADMAISAAGSTCWELAYMELPSLILVLADNQQGIASGLEKVGFARCAGDKVAAEAAIAEQLAFLADSERLRKQMSSVGRKLVDGMGPARVVKRLLSMS